MDVFLFSKACCAGIAGFDMAYNQYGKLRTGVELGYPIYECNKRLVACRNFLSSSCQNRGTTTEICR